ncbi:hypothetical protein VP1G_07844 [Cytospora mali]|uniref:Uncharacterized protein n=1 Tax=Cytospora mali TaxID=578113 RepID=A0A194V9R3_CYTMA|nr:hypothetical protein VP1G_07844 [Valsa mali var. pyri (nom. inval.)]
MAGLFEQRGNGRPFGDIVNPFEEKRTPNPPPQPRPDPNAWRATFGPNPFNPAAQAQERQRERERRRGRGRIPVPAAADRPRTWAHPDLRPPQPILQPYRNDILYFNAQRHTFRQPVAVAPVRLGVNGTAGTSPGPAALPLTGQENSNRNACGAVFGHHIDQAGHFLGSVYGDIVFLWDETFALVSLLRDLLWFLARCAALWFVTWWVGTVSLRLWILFCKPLTEFFLGKVWRYPANYYELRREFTMWSVTPLGGIGAVDRMVRVPGRGASFWTISSTYMIPRAMQTTEKALAEGFRLANLWNVTLVWNITVTTMTAVLWNFIGPVDQIVL